MAASANERLATEQDGVAHRVARRTANKRMVAVEKPKTDTQGLVELRCSATSSSASAP